MSTKIIICGQFPIKPGQTEQGKAAARSLRERVLREDEGVTLYEFFIDEANEVMAITEGYADEPSLMKHIEASDFAPLFETFDIEAGTIQIHGNPSDALRKTLHDIVGPVEIFLPV